MPLSSKTRWMLYAVAAAATAGAMTWVDEKGGDQADVVQPVRRAATSSAAAAPVSVQAEVQVRLDQLRRPAATDLPKGDPFASASPPPPPEAAAPPPRPAPPQAPPLPFAYLGKWTEQGITTIFLARGDSHVSVKAPGKLDDTYAVESIGETEIVFRFLPMGTRQVLPLAPAADRVHTAGSAPAAAPEESSEETN